MEKIPKVIHYCWFGRGPKSSLINKCIASWQKYLFDYEIIEWNEDNFDLDTNIFVKEAYQCQKYAFVSDYVRLYVLYKYGGIYMDTDCEVLKPLDKFLNHESFSGYEKINLIPTAIMGAKKNNYWIKMLLDYYQDRHFILSDGNLDTTTNVLIISKITSDAYNLTLNNQEINFNGNVIYPKEYFCPKNGFETKALITKNTYTIHHFNGSWHDDKTKLRNQKKLKLVKVFGLKIGTIILELNEAYSRYGLVVLLKKIQLKVKKRLYG